ncbi:MAG TPA: hypothetical protein VGJ70_17435 [Solirubrobacteraceae bacterium]
MSIWFIVPILILGAIVVGYILVNRAAAARIADRHGGDAGRAVADEKEPVPSTHLIPDDQRPLGDTPGAHDEINPRDIPLDNPARQEAEARVGGESGETRGG